MVRQRIAYPVAITALAWSPESERLVTGVANQVTFLTALTGTVLASFPHDHLATVTSLAWTAHNQQQVVSGALDQQAIVWQTTLYQPQTIFTRHTAPIEAVSWAADGQMIASSSHGGVVRVWNAESGREEGCVRRVATSDHAIRAATAAGSRDKGRPGRPLLRVAGRRQSATGPLQQCR